MKFQSPRLYHPFLTQNSVLFLFYLIFIISLQLVHSQVSVSGNNNPTVIRNGDLTNQIILDQSIGYTLGWQVEPISKSIYFNISAKTNGYLALALSKKRNQVDGSDVVICGITSDGNPYVLDMRCNNGTVQRDASQDWRIISAQRSAGRTTFTIARNLDTCDDEDVSMLDGVLHASWGLGSGNVVQSGTRFVPRGELPIYFQDPTVSTNIRKEIKRPWRVSRRFQVPSRHTSYWCKIIRGPQLATKHQIVEFRPYLPNDLSRRHVHHQLLYRCIAPPGVDPASIFERFNDHPGEECYLNDSPTMPSALCREMVHMFAVGGMGAELPASVGFPVESNEYFLFEVHYDNPNVRSDLIIESGVDFQLSSQLRPNDGSMLFMGYGVYGTFVIPPKSPDFNIVGLCSPECTREMLPGTGIEIIGVTMHGHTNTKRMRMKHYRGNKELPWIINDDNYDFNVQQARFLSKPVTILPGDQIITQCGYDNTFKNGSTVSGFSTRDEMCMAFLYVNRRIPYLYCTSEYPTELTMDRFGIENMAWEVNQHERIIHTAISPNHVGQRFSQVVDAFNWTPAVKHAVEAQQMFGSHDVSCPNLNDIGQAAYRIFMAQQTDVEVTQSASRLSGATISTPFSSSTTQYPSTASVYSPPTSCQQTLAPSWNTLAKGHFNWGDRRRHQNTLIPALPNYYSELSGQIPFLRKRYGIETQSSKNWFG